MRRILGIVLAVLLLGGVVTAVVAGRQGEDKGTATKTVRGVIGSEKTKFFQDPDVVEALADKGWKVQVEPSGSWAMEERGLKGYDFAFPSSKAPADALAAKYHAPEPLPRPFYSPLVVVAHRSAAEVLAANKLATLEGNRGILDMDAYLKAVQRGTTWQQLKGAEKHGELRGTVFVTTTDPLSSNSGALFLAATSFVANGERVVTDDAGVDRTAPLLHTLTTVQGAQKSSSDEPFQDFLAGVGDPLVLVYESQVAALLQRDDPGDLTVLYPDVTVTSDHTVVPLTGNGREFGELLESDPTLRSLEVRYGFRLQGSTADFTKATGHFTEYINQQLTGVRQAPVPTSKVLHDMAERARG